MYLSLFKKLTFFWTDPNLVGNAVKFTKEGNIRVKLEMNEKIDETLRLHFSISDTGIGIKKENQSAIFKAFTQADGATTRHYGGTGLGLAICYRLVKMMGGEIWVDSEHKKGSVFHFIVPLTQSKNKENKREEATDGQDPEQTIPPASSCSLNILLAEDNAANRELMKIILEKSGHKLYMVENGKEALLMMPEQHFDLVFLDIQMPEMNGYETAKEIRKLEKEADKPSTLLIALTAYAMPEEKQMCLKSGMDDYLSKPITEQIILEKIREWIEKKQRK